MESGEDERVGLRLRGLGYSRARRRMVKAVAAWAGPARIGGAWSKGCLPGQGGRGGCVSVVKRGFLWAECCLRERVRVRFPAQGDMLLTMALCRGTPRMPSAAGIRPSLALGAVSSAQRGTFLTTAPAGGFAVQRNPFWDGVASDHFSTTEARRTRGSSLYKGIDRSKPAVFRFRYTLS